MIEITAEIRALIDKAVAGMELAGDEYIDPTDGLIQSNEKAISNYTGEGCCGR